jgi:hypothetical protein
MRPVFKDDINGFNTTVAAISQPTLPFQITVMLRCREWVRGKRRLMTIRCDYCRRSFGLIAQRYWRMQFCSADCVEAYQLRLDEGTRAKIRFLDVVAPTTTPRTQYDWTTNRIEAYSANLNAPLKRSA